MKKNMGRTDSILRLLIAVVIVALYFTNIIQGVFAIILLIVAGIFLLTAVIGVCPLYTLFGISSCKIKTKL
ncbi:MAG: DUF2892 domain-containing protein [Ferruginibacter sp.]